MIVTVVVLGIAIVIVIMIYSNSDSNIYCKSDGNNTRDCNRPSDCSNDSHSLNRVAPESRCAHPPHIAITRSLLGSTHWNTCFGLELGSRRRARTTSGALPCWRYTTAHGHVSAHLEGDFAGNIRRLTEDVTEEQLYE